MTEFGGLANHQFIRVVLIIAALLVIQFIVRRVIDQVVSRAISSHHYLSKREQQQRLETLTSLFKAATTVIVWVIAIIVILQELGVNLAALATGAGLIGIVVGFGAQSMIKDFLSGMFIILENQYRIGDVVTIAGHSGVVEHVSIRMTKLRDLDGSVYFVPNGEITTVQNMTLEFSNVVIDVSVSYETDVSLAEKIINEVGEKLAEDPDWQDRIIEPVKFLRVDKFGESGVYLKALGKVNPAEQWGVAGEYRKRLMLAFEAKGIEIPLPQRVIHDEKSRKKK